MHAREAAGYAGGAGDAEVGDAAGMRIEAEADLVGARVQGQELALASSKDEAAAAAVGRKGHEGGGGGRITRGRARDAHRSRVSGPQLDRCDVLTKALVVKS
jgi:hypothetical protein